MSMDKQICLRLADLMLGGETPSGDTGPRTKTAQVAALGWRILPVPNFWKAGELWHDKNGNGNPAHIDFAHVREWLVIPPESTGLRARKFTGRRPAIQWAYSLAAERRDGRSEMPTSPREPKP